MGIKKQIGLLVISILLSSCAPKVKTVINESYPPLNFRDEVVVLSIADPIPSGATELGTIKISDTGFSTNCKWDIVIDKAKMEARQFGGNVVKIIDHIPPGLRSTCDQITALVLYVEDIENIDALLAKASQTEIDTTIDYAILYVYRPTGIGPLVFYKLHLGESVICNVKAMCKEKIHIYKDGMNTLWAKTESRVEIPINIEIGRSYYVRCGVEMGLLVGRPSLKLVDNSIGKTEYNSLKD